MFFANGKFISLFPVIIMLTYSLVQLCLFAILLAWPRSINFSVGVKEAFIFLVTFVLSTKTNVSDLFRLIKIFMQDFSPIKKKIQEVLDFKALTKYQFYKKSGMTRGVLGKESGISEENIAKFIAYFPDVSLDWLIKDQGEMFSAAQSNYSGVNEGKTAYKEAKIGIPLIPIDAMAGVGGGNVSIKEGDILDRYVIPDFADVDFMIRIQGSSMEPNFNSGDVIACKIILERTFFQWGRVFVIHHREQGTMVKRLFPDVEGKIECKSDNSKYPSFILNLSEVTNIALVKGVVRLE